MARPHKPGEIIACCVHQKLYWRRARLGRVSRNPAPTARPAQQREYAVVNFGKVNETMKAAPISSGTSFSLLFYSRKAIIARIWDSLSRIGRSRDRDGFGISSSNE
jgi:hypothetical protein